MNVSPELLQNAIVHQAVSQASVTILSQQIADAQQALADKAKQAAELQGVIDALAADRKKLADEHAAALAKAEADVAAEQAKLLRLATMMDFPNVDAMLNAIKPNVTEAAPMPSDSEGGETT